MADKDDFDMRKTPGMKHRDFQRCICCGKGMMHGGQFTFFRIRLERFIVDLAAVQRAHGMEMMMGGTRDAAVLANIMGPDEDLAKQLPGVHEVLICDPCATGRMPCAAELYEVAQDRAHEREERAAAKAEANG